VRGAADEPSRRPSRFNRRSTLLALGLLIAVVSVVGAFIIRGHNSELVACDASTGHRLWHTQLPVATLGTPVQSEGLVFVYGGSIPDDSAGTLFALDAATGHRVWQATSQGFCGGARDVPNTPDVAAGVAIARTSTGSFRG